MSHMGMAGPGIGIVRITVGFLLVALPMLAFLVFAAL